MVDIFERENIFIEGTNARDIFAEQSLEVPKKQDKIKQILPPATDIFQEEILPQVSITEKNLNALNNIINLQLPDLDETYLSIKAEATRQASDFDRLARTRFSEEQINEWRNNPISFSEAGDFLDIKDVVPLGGIKKAADTFGIINISKKVESGEELDPEEQKKLNDFIDKTVEMRTRGFSFGGGIAYYGSQMPAFMVEFAATGGVGKLAQTAAVKGATKLGTKLALGTVASKTVGLAANVTARTAVMPSLYAPNYAERRLNDFTAITDKGELLFKESKETPAMSALKAFAYTEAEVASELSGAAIGKYVVSPIAKTLKTPLIQGVNKLPMKVKQGLYSAYKKINPNAQVSKVFSRAGWNGMIEELGEEQVNRILQESINLTLEEGYTFDQVMDGIIPSKDQLMLEAGLVSIAGGVKTSADITFNLLKQKGMIDAEAQEAVKNMSAIEQEAFVEQEIKLPESGFDDWFATDREITDFRIATSQLDKEQQVQANEIIDRLGKIERWKVESDMKYYSQEIQDWYKQNSITAGIAASFRDNSLDNDIIASQIESLEAEEPPPINNEESNFNIFYRDWVNSLQPIEDLTKKASELDLDVSVGEDPQLLARTYAGAIGAAKQNLQVETFVINKEGNVVRTGKALKPILDDFDNSVLHIEANRKQREVDFNDYLVARRFIEDLQDREDVEVSEADRIKSLKTMAALSQKYGEDFAFFDTYAQEIYDYQKRILNNLVISGVISEDSYNAILKKNPNYIPFQRVLEGEEFKDFVSAKGIFTNANANKVIKAIKGSEKEVKNTFQSIIRNTVHILDISHRNKIATSIANLSQYMPENIQKTDKAEGAISVYRNGEKEYYKVSKPILEAVNRLHPAKLGFMEKLFTFPATVLRAGATLNPEFWVRNVLRDQSTALIQSKVRPTPVDMVKGLFAVIGKNDLYNEWMKTGGSFNSYMELSDTGLEKAYNELFRPRGRMERYLRNPLHILEDISGGLEQATRIGAFSKAKEKGLSGLQAAFESREATLDFARGGAKGKIVNRIIPFFNAGIQGSDKLIRLFKNNPKETIFWGTATITIPSIFLTGYYLYAADDEDREEYLEIPQWQKDMFWCFKVDGEWKRYPKPFSLGYIFGSVPERAMLWMYDGDKPEGENMFKEVVMGLGGSISPVYDASALIPPLFKTIIEDVTNYNFFLGRNIYPSWMDILEPEERKQKFTSETAILIGEQLGVSPAIVDNTLRGTLAGSAKYITDAGDIIINQVKEWNGETIPERPITDSDIPVLKAFAIRDPSGFRAVSTQNFYKNWKEIQQKHATWNKKDGEERKEYFNKNKEIILQYKPIKEFNKKIRNIGKQIDAIYDDTKMKSEEKVKRIAKLEKQIVKVAKQANKLYNEATEKED